MSVQTFEHSELKIKECSNAEIAHSFGPYSEEILNNYYIRYIQDTLYVERYMDPKCMSALIFANALQIRKFAKL